MVNDTSLINGTLLTMVPLDLTPAMVYPAFIFGTLTYCFILFWNLMLLTTIAMKRTLHKPMFILLFNLPICDIIGATAFFPQLLLSIILQNRSITFAACYTQALLAHLYGSGNLLFLTAMAYDRYVAICWPLRYNSVMTQSNLVRIVVIVWLIDFTLILLLLGLAARLRVCRRNVVDMYCNNPSLVKLLCGDTSVNNYYGVFITVLIQGGSLLVIVFTYIQILITCLKNNQSDARMKAIQTCGTHLVVFLLLELNTACTLISHRLQNAPPYLRRALGVSVLVFPPIMNPLIYGLQTKEIKKNMMAMLKVKSNCIRKGKSTR